MNTEILSDITVHMKYAKYNQDISRRETWEEIVERNMQMHIKTYPKSRRKLKMSTKISSEQKSPPIHAFYAIWWEAYRN